MVQVVALTDAQLSTSIELCIATTHSVHSCMYPLRYRVPLWTVRCGTGFLESKYVLQLVQSYHLILKFGVLIAECKVSEMPKVLNSQSMVAFAIVSADLFGTATINSIANRVRWSSIQGTAVHSAPEVDFDPDLYSTKSTDIL